MLDIASRSKCWNTENVSHFAQLYILVTNLEHNTLCSHIKMNLRRPNSQTGRRMTSNHVTPESETDKKGIVPGAPSVLLCVLRSSAYDFLEGFPEIPVENRVYDRVHWAVAITNPKEKLEKCDRDVAALSADSVQGVSKEEWEPAKHKHPHDYRQHEGETFLSHLGHFGLVGRSQLLSPGWVLLLRVKLERPRRSPG